MATRRVETLSEAIQALTSAANKPTPSRKSKKVTSDDLAKSLEELERREEALKGANLWPEGRSVWDRLTEEEPDDIGENK